MGGLSALVERVFHLGKGGQAAHATLQVTPKMAILGVDIGRIIG